MKIHALTFPICSYICKSRNNQNQNQKYKMNGFQEYNSPIFSFPPVADTQSKLLILGTIPGKESLRKNAYYAHPQNAFWKIIFTLLELPLSTDYQTRTASLLENGIALWDVLKMCNRETSLDTDIRSEFPNDIRGFLHSHPTITQLCFNGKGAARFFHKYFRDISLPKHVLPSTSPSHAIRWEQKLSDWQIIKNHG